jgi:hypothetical protein
MFRKTSVRWAARLGVVATVVVTSTFGLAVAANATLIDWGFVGR